MENFNYFTPTHILFGRGEESKIGALIQNYHCKKVLVLYGGRSAVKSGLIQRIAQWLDESGVSYCGLGGIVSNPILSFVYEGIELCKKEKIDFILAVGGGSVIDTAKAIGYGVTNEGDVWDFYKGIREANACLPIGAVLTIAAAGSEMSNSSVITNEDGMIKRAYDNDVCRLKFAIMNPELTMTLPAYQTASGCVDIMMHTMERYFNQSDNMEVTDQISEAIMRTVVKYAKILVTDPENYKARAEIMWAGSLAHNGLTGCGTDGGDWACHKMEHELSGLFNVAHGAGLASIWASWARYVFRFRPERFVQFAVNVMGVHGENEEETIQLGIAEVEKFYQYIKMPVSISELIGHEITDEQIRVMAEKCSRSATRGIGIVRKLVKEDIERIYDAAR